MRAGVAVAATEALEWAIAENLASGSFFDTSGTLAVEMIRPGFDWASVHTTTGQIALWLMLAHAIWATRVVRRGSEEARGRFHRYSLVVWGIWLIPYIGGMFLGMAG